MGHGAQGCREGRLNCRGLELQAAWPMCSHGHGGVVPEALPSLLPLPGPRSILWQHVPWEVRMPITYNRLRCGKTPVRSSVSKCLATAGHECRQRASNTLLAASWYISSSSWVGQGSGGVGTDKQGENGMDQPKWAHVLSLLSHLLDRTLANGA